MKFSLAAITVSLFRSASAAVPTSWTGSMTQNIYTPNCTDAALVSVDTTTSLVALGNSTLCETDVSGGIEFYSKIIVSCAHIEDSEHPVTMSAYLCTDSLCSNCSETASIDGWSSIEDLVNLTPDTCFSWKTISDDLNQTDAPLNEMFSDTSDSYWKYTSSSDVVAGFFEVFLGNTCIADYENHAEDSFPYTATEEGEEDGHGHPHGSEEEEDGHGHPHGSNVFAGTEAGGPSSSARVWGLSLSISAVAGLTGAILSV